MHYLEIFLIFFKMGALIFGAGHALASAIQEESVDRGWLTEKEYQDGWSAGSGLPGPISIKMVVYVGYKAGYQKGKRTGGVIGALLSTVGYILPCSSLMLITSLLFSRFKDSQIVQNVLKGIKPAVLAIIIVAAYRFFRTGSISDIRTSVITIASLGLIIFLDISPVFIIIGAAIIGLSYFLF
ncbi:TPA: chromate transporter [Candidatus Poribacteria bacterium]|nr:chromate transporter [Candidatus Poribacteria bacterium]